MNIIFATGFSRYREAAFDLHASGYLTKPITTDKVRKELAELRRPVAKAKRMRVQTFGNFEVYVDGRPLEFRYSRTKEMLAYLVDRQGALCTVGEVQAVLFEDETGHESYMKSLRQDLQVTLDEAGCGGVLVKQWGKLAVQTSAFDCDYYDWREGRREGLSYQGEYMSQYRRGFEPDLTARRTSCVWFRRIPGRLLLRIERRRRIILLRGRPRPGRFASLYHALPADCNRKPPAPLFDG